METLSVFANLTTVFSEPQCKILLEKSEKILLKDIESLKHLIPNNDPLNNTIKSLIIILETLISITELPFSKVIVFFYCFILFFGVFFRDIKK